MSVPNFNTTPFTLMDLKEPDLEFLAQIIAANILSLVGNYNARQQQNNNFPVGITLWKVDAMSNWLSQDILRLNAYYWAICRRHHELRSADVYALFDPEPYRIFAAEAIAPPPAAETAPASGTTAPPAP